MSEVGKTYGFYEILEEYMIGKRKLCKCLCLMCLDEYVDVTTAKLIEDMYRPCKCFKFRSKYRKAIKHGFNNGGKTDVIYGRFLQIWGRCYKKHNKRYKDYGGRGIKVWYLWEDQTQESIESFRNYILALYPDALRMMSNDKYEIDRINNNGNYEPGNLRLATSEEQKKNMSRNIKVEYKGQMLCASELYRLLKPNVVRSTFEIRLKAGEDPEYACRDGATSKNKVVRKCKKD